MARLRGLEQSQEQDQSQLIRDTRTIGQRTADFFKNPIYVTVLLAGCAMAAFMLPAITDVVLLIGLGCLLYAYSRKSTLPFRLPQRSNQTDYNDLISGSDKARKAR